MATILPQEAEAFLEKLPIEKFHGIGKATATKMHNIGVYNGYDLKQHSLIDLSRRFGKSGRFYYNIVRGIDERPVRSHWIRKSISTEETYETDLDNMADMMTALEALAHDLQQRIARTNTQGRTLTLKLKYANFQTVTRSKTVEEDILTTAQILPLVPALITDTEAIEKKVRLLGLGISNLRNQDQDPLDEGGQLRFDF